MSETIENKKRINLTEKQFDLFKSLLIAIVSGLCVVLFQQLFFKSNVDYELRKDILKENYEYYVAIQNFTDLNNYTQYHFEIVENVGTPRLLINIHTKDTIGRDTIYNYENRNEKITIPTISGDTIKQKKWKEDKEYIEINKNKIDQEIYSEFNEIVRIVEKNPWPTVLKLDSLRKSIWSDKEFEQNWFEKNLLLHYKIGEIIKIK